MIPKILILCTCRNEELFGATTLVFDTVRIGFPTAEIIVFDNANSELHRSEIREHVKVAKGKFVHLPERLPHAPWIEAMVQAALDDPESEPFWICDTDVIFWDNVEQLEFPNEPLAGRYVPDFYDKFTRCMTQKRLHTSLLYVNPKVLRERLEHFTSRFPKTEFNPMANLYGPLHIPPSIFYDACSMLYLAVGGHSFLEGELNRYDHLQCGTISDLVGPHISDGKMTERHKAYISNPESARGLWKDQDKYLEYYRTHTYAAA